MAKLIVGKAPAEFPLTVEIPTPEGESEVTFTARHLRASTWATLREKHRAKIDKIVESHNAVNRLAAEKLYAAKVASGALVVEAGNDEELAARKEAAILQLVEPIPESEIAKVKAEVNGAMLAEIFTGWDLANEFTEHELIDMCDLYPGAPVACYAKYNLALEGRRLGNSKPSPQATTSDQ